VIIIRNTILSIIDFFYPPFKKILDLQTFRYLACGGSNQLLNIFIFWFSFYILFDKSGFDLSIAHIAFNKSIHMGADTASYIMASFITIPIGFLLSKYIVFQQSNIKGRIQLFRYVVLTITCFFLNYVLLKLFHGILNIPPTTSQTLIIIILAIFSYIVQRFFTFKVKNIPEQAEL
jgi:putative flippase GtrA